jgi:hypothetical protein
MVYLLRSASLVHPPPTTALCNILLYVLFYSQGGEERGGQADQRRLPHHRLRRLLQADVQGADHRHRKP